MRLICLIGVIVSSHFGFLTQVTHLHAQTQYELNRQAAEDHRKADEQMNRVYQELQKTLDPEGQKLLRASQRAWLKFRDAEAKFAADEWRGGSASPLLYHGAHESLTQQRIRQLESRMPERIENEVIEKKKTPEGKVRSPPPQ